MEFVLQVQIQSILKRFPNDFKRSEERALMALKRRFNPFLRITVQIQFTTCPNGTQITMAVAKSRSCYLLCFGILCISFLWGVIFDGHGGRQRQEFYVLEWLIGVMDRKWVEP
ncbi:hypothetical protein SUGI_0916800 [Cryptomeria japonica]|nr:hypothetical protein SUGI_0916800 [Cryptomeria japonica]